MKKIVYALILLLLVVSGLVLANRESEKEASNKPIPKPLTAAEKDAERKKWEASPDGVLYKKWEASPAGQKVLAGAAKIGKYISDSSNMEAVVSSLTLPPGSRLGFGVMVQIEGEEYILSFGLETDDEFRQLQSLKVNDKIVIRSRAVSHAPKYAFPIINADYVERDGKEMYKRAPNKGGC